MNNRGDEMDRVEARFFFEVSFSTATVNTLSLPGNRVRIYIVKYPIILISSKHIQRQIKPINEPCPLTCYAVALCVE